MTDGRPPMMSVATLAKHMEAELVVGGFSDAVVLEMRAAINCGPAAYRACRVRHLGY
jgi:hypothetical protein